MNPYRKPASRQSVQRTCRQLTLDSLHVGLYADYGEIICDERYRESTLLFSERTGRP